MFLLSKPLRLRGLKFNNADTIKKVSSSKPLRLRGLKWRVHRQVYDYENGRSLCGFVDWNALPTGQYLPHMVEAFAASWIEIHWDIKCAGMQESKPLRLRGLKWYITINVNGITRRSLCGFVDWNGFAKRGMIPYGVEAFAASWIEIILKWHKIHCIFVEAFAASWIEIF